MFPITLPTLSPRDKIAMRWLLFFFLLAAPAFAKPAQPNAQPAQPVAPATTLEPTAPASAPEGRQFGDWAVFQYTESGSVTCYAATKTGNAFIYVTHRPAERTEYEFQFTAPKNLKPGSVATLHVDKDKFKLFVDGNNAWIRGSENDKAIATALGKGRKISLTATGADGKNMTVKFSAKGSGMALKAINQACGV